MSKETNLRSLQAAGFNVPPFAAVPAQLYERFLRGLPQPIDAESVKAASVPEDLAREILRLAQTLPPGPLAVRSSLSSEDSATHSFAGQLDSFLNVRGDDAVVAAVKACWASAHGERVLAYCREHGLATDGLSMTVILQAMVPAEVSGVLFTADPTGGAANGMLVSAAPGLGEALARGEVDGETWRVDPGSGSVEGDGRILTREQLLSLAGTARRIELLFGSPQDIELAWAGGECFILQARPITTLGSAGARGEQILWDNSNITESYSGVTTPLTYSVIREAYAQVYRQFLGVMGVRNKGLGFLRTLLGFYNGQVYYQLHSWYQALACLPAFDRNRRLMEQMMGVKQSAGEKTRGSAAGGLALALWAVRLVVLHSTHGKRVRRFLEGFAATLAEYEARDLNACSPRELRHAYLDLTERVLGAWRAPILTDFFAMIFVGALRALSRRWPDFGGALFTDLLAGEGAIESLAPLRRVHELAAEASADGALRAALAGDPAQAWQRIATEPRFAPFYAALEDYLRRYGDRCMNELKLEEPNLRDDPARLIGILAATVDHPLDLGRAAGIRAQAEGRLADLPAGRRLPLRWLLRHARRHVRDRENMRFARTRLFGLVRRLINALGAQWESAGVLDAARDVYYLTIGEIWDFVEGTAVTQDLRALTAVRKAEFARHRTRRAPDRFETRGLPYLDRPRDLLAQTESAPNQLQGTPCCSGRVQARARVVQSVDGVTDLRGDILVAERTDPGWVFLFTSASGILVERGSPLSHSAIVARELGKPTIVNIPGLTQRVHTGDLLDMDGEAGVVRRAEA